VYVVAVSAEVYRLNDLLTKIYLNRYQLLISFNSQLRVLFNFICQLGKVLSIRKNANRIPCPDALFQPLLCP
jgi:hypothetical protein